MYQRKISVFVDTSF